MSFGFLTPLFLAGLAAIAIPVLVHLVRREERASFAFPSLMFLKSIPVREHRRRTVRHWWLLLLRCLIIALLCLAFARPFIQWPPEVAGAFSESRDQVVLLDRSHSMQAGRRWRDAVGIAGEVIDGLGDGDRGALVLFDGEVLLAQKLTTNHAELRAALDAASSGDGHTDLAAALARASALLEQSDAEHRAIVVISDFQQTAVPSGEPLAVAPGIEVIPRSVAAPAGANAAVANVKMARKALGSGDAVELTARVVNTGIEPMDGVELVMEVAGEAREHQVMDLAPGEARDALFRLVLAAGEVLPVRVHIGDDALAADNSFRLMVSGATAIATLLVEDRGARAEKSLHLREALNQGEAPGFRVTPRYLSQLRAEDIDQADVIIINDAPIPAGELGERLRRFVESGGGLLVVAGAGLQGAWPGGDLGLVPGRLGPSHNRPAGSAGRLVRMNNLHPALAAFAGKEDGDLSAAQIFRYRDLDGIDGQSVLARYDDERVALAERGIGHGRVLVLTTTLDPSWNTLALQPGYLPIVHESLKYLASHVPAIESVHVGETLELESYARGLPGYTQSTAALARGSVTTLRTPSGRQLRLAPGDAFAHADEAGFYEGHVSGGGARTLVFAANPLPRESELAALDVDALMDTIDFHASGGETRQAAAQRSPDSGAGQDGWWFLLLICALLLGLDTLFSNRLSRQVPAS